MTTNSLTVLFCLAIFAMLFSLTATITVVFLRKSRVSKGSGAGFLNYAKVDLSTGEIAKISRDEWLKTSTTDWTVADDFSYEIHAGGEPAARIAEFVPKIDRMYYGTLENLTGHGRC